MHTHCLAAAIPSSKQSFCKALCLFCEGAQKFHFSSAWALVSLFPAMQPHVTHSFLMAFNCFNSYMKMLTLIFLKKPHSKI